MNRTRLIVTVLVLAVAAGPVLGVSVGADEDTAGPADGAPVAAMETVSQDGINVTTDYPASDESQAVDVTVTISPTETGITNVSVALSNSRNAYVDFDSFSISLDPSGAAEVEEELRVRGGERRKVYVIDSLDTDETVTITFQSYPRRLQSSDQTLDVASVDYEFLRNGVPVPDDGPGRITAVADISSSPQYERQRLQSRVDSLWLTVGVSLVVGLIGLVLAAVLFVRSRNDDGSISRTQLRNVTNDVEELQRRLSARGDDEGASQAESIRESLENLRR